MKRCILHFDEASGRGLRATQAFAPRRTQGTATGPGEVACLAGARHGAASPAAFFGYFLGGTRKYRRRQAPEVTATKETTERCRRGVTITATNGPSGRPVPTRRVGRGKPLPYDIPRKCFANRAINWNLSVRIFSAGCADCIKSWHKACADFQLRF